MQLGCYTLYNSNLSWLEYIYYYKTLITLYSSILIKLFMGLECREQFIPESVGSANAVLNA
jgi:hypothetical protein